MTAHNAPSGTAESVSLWQRSHVLIGTTKFPRAPTISNILITGGAGFIASWLVRHLALQYPDYNVICFDKLDYCASFNNIAYVNANCHNFKFVKGDITNPDEVEAVLRDQKIDTILHLAAMSHVDLSFGRDSYEFTSVNVYGTHVLLESARTYGKVTRFIHVSTDEVYGEVHAEDTDLLESAILAPTNPYAATKSAADMLVNAYYKSFKLPVIIVRCNNVYGPHQFPEKIIPKFICLLESRRKCSIHGDGSNSRRYLFAGDAVDALDTILHKGTIGQIYNIGTSDEISNRELCKLLLMQFGYREAEFDQHIEYTNDRPFNDRRYAIDASRLKSLGWIQKTRFEDGISITIAWYRLFGLSWWGDISDILSAFPTNRHIKADIDGSSPD
ncbi:hypothetical protein POJ06DRAFT_240380 [Lipomyces tetrasporus]|uniref:NAD(P)-binding domain-containing protein n=1 Tax=Lipomyces tetrasporus TaxID=54092 RepID=A0AAD7QQ80_9ASCO|nr:uncharacterized protein POJ06DRAFT_240380 [Lipomyces tetrasporus]KAJ8097862.1 hypothetical protein POJ06DRAFT_240380 [Lipomyces tetrasporus]